LAEKNGEEGARIDLFWPKWEQDKLLPKIPKMKQHNAIQVFEETQVRTIWDADQEKW
jgi:hypothetical protein